MIECQVVVETISTNDDVAGRATAGAAEGFWLRAIRQTGGRGRQGRTWNSDTGNLHASTLIRHRPGDPPAPTLAFVAAVSLHQLLSVYAPGADLWIKWPNDLMLGDAKLSGILLEKTGDAVVVGFGVNLASHPLGLDRPVTSLPEAGFASPDVDVFVHELAMAFSYWLGRWRGEGLKSVRERWLTAAHPPGTPLIVRTASGNAVEGLFDGLETDGALRLRLADGSRHVIHAGDVFVL